VRDGGVAVLAAQAAATRDGGIGRELVAFLVQQTQRAFAHELVSVVGDGVTHHARCGVELGAGRRWWSLIVEKTTHGAAVALGLRRGAGNARAT